MTTKSFSAAVSREQNHKQSGHRKNEEENTNSSSFASVYTFLIEQKTISWASSGAREEAFPSMLGALPQAASIAAGGTHSLTRVLHLPSSYGFSAFASWSRGGESPQTRAGRGGSREREGDAWQTAPLAQVSQPVAESCSECRRSLDRNVHPELA